MTVVVRNRSRSYVLRTADRIRDEPANLNVFKHNYKEVFDDGKRFGYVVRTETTNRSNRVRIGTGHYYDDDDGGQTVHVRTDHNNNVSATVKGGSCLLRGS